MIEHAILRDSIWSHKSDTVKQQQSQLNWENMLLLGLWLPSLHLRRYIYKRSSLQLVKLSHDPIYSTI